MKTQRDFGTVATAPGFGYTGRPDRIMLDDGHEVQVRYAAIRGKGLRTLTVSEQVSCLLEETTKGLFAVCVHREHDVGSQH